MRKICPNCGSELPEKAMFCFICGTKVEGTAQTGETEAAEKTGEPESTEEGTEIPDFQEAETIGVEDAEEEAIESAEEETAKPGEEETEAGEAAEMEVIEAAEVETVEPGEEETEAGEAAEMEVIEPAEVETVEPEEVGSEEPEEAFWKMLPETTAKKTFHKPKMSKKKKKIFGVVAAVIAIFVIYAATRPNIVSIEATYDGNTEEGVVLDESNDGIKVTGTDENGELYDISGWTVNEAETLEADGTSRVEIDYKDISDVLTVECSTYTIEGVDVSYEGDTEEGAVLDEYNNGITVTGITPKGKEIDLEAGEWTIENPVTLEADKTAAVTIKYDGQEYPLNVKCTTTRLKSISAEYDGKTEKGTVLDEDNEGITVYAHYYNGDKKEVYDWKVKKSVKLKAGETSKVTIKYEGKKCTLKVKCTSMTKQQYKDKCKEISYDTLARDPDDHIGKMVKFTGKIVQVMEDGDDVALRINVTNDGYGYYDDTVYVDYTYKDGESRLLEDDIVTFYGLYAGLYTYESVMGASITIPWVFADYIDN